MRAAVFTRKLVAAMRNSPAFSLPLVLAAVLLSACASGGKTDVASGASSARCALRAEDSVYARAKPVYRDCAVQRQAKLIPSNVNPDFSPPPSSTSCYSAEVEFVVDAAGMYEPGTARVVRASSQPFAEAIVAVLPRYKFDPAMVDGVAVRQITSIKRSAEVMVRVVSSNGPTGTAAPRRSSAPKC